MRGVGSLAGSVSVCTAAEEREQRGTQGLVHQPVDRHDRGGVPSRRLVDERTVDARVDGARDVAHARLARERKRAAQRVHSNLLGHGRGNDVCCGSRRQRRGTLGGGTDQDRREWVWVVGCDIQSLHHRTNYFIIAVADRKQQRPARALKVNDILAAIVACCVPKGS